MTRVALFGDFLEERWASMDLVADELLRSLREETPANTPGESWSVGLIRPPMRRRFSAERAFSGKGYNADRLVNRFFDYPREVRTRHLGHELFHVIDHSYSQLVHELPGDRTVVTCHDLDTFRCLWEPGHGGRGAVFQAMTRRILAGMKKAAHICCVSEATRSELLGRNLAPADRTSVVRLGVRPEFAEEPDAAAAAVVEKWLGSSPAVINLLHVGSTIPRKRIDVLLEIFARVRTEIGPGARLLRVGGEFTAAQKTQCRQLGLQSEIVELPFLSPRELAAVYRRADLVLVPSEAEGFGLPVIEALACGTPVLASDLAVLTEVGGAAATYARVAAVEDWVENIRLLLQERSQDPAAWMARRDRGREQAAKFSWRETARQTYEIYRIVLAQAQATAA
jgi:glycosyltransferase involved in cell wall biosynthesis